MAETFNNGDDCHAGRRAIFTIVSANYIAFAATLMQSVELHDPGVDRYIFLADAMYKFPDLELSATLLTCDEIGINNIGNMKIWYSVIEFNTAIKPYCFLFLFEKMNYEKVCYVDPDIQLFKPLAEAFCRLDDHSCILTPHMMRPLQDGKEPSDLTIMKSGVYNLGFLGLKNDSDGRNLAKWWADRCYDGCRVDIPGNRFTDQRWMDLAPAFVSRPFILRDPGYNVAYWNLAHRVVTYENDNGWMVNGSPLVFFHFSGIKPDDESVFSKHTNRFDSSNIGIVAELCQSYRLKVRKNKWENYSKIPYAFGTFSNGRPIEDLMRNWVARNIEEGNLNGKAPLKMGSEFFDEIDESAFAKGASLTRYMYQMWCDRADLQVAFNIFEPDDLRRYYEWFLSDKDVRKNVDGRSLFAATVLQSGNSVSPSVKMRRIPPWPSVSEESWDGPAEKIREFLARDIVVVLNDKTVRVPCVAALLWEMRFDLAEHFALETIESIQEYLAWFLTHGAKEANFDFSLLTPEFISDFTAVNELSRFYGDVPLTDGILILRNVIKRQIEFGSGHFPIDKRARVSYGIWFAVCAPKIYGWPDDLVEPVLDYFRRPINLRLGQFALNRATYSIWELRTDLHKQMPLQLEEDVAHYMMWLLLHGLREFRISAERLDPDLCAFLRTQSARYRRLTRLQELVYDSRSDLREMFNLDSRFGCDNFISWASEHLPSEYSEILSSVYDRSGIQLANKRNIRTKLVLTGQWHAASGRGEDVRCSAKSLLAVGESEFLIFDLDSCQLMDMDGRPIMDCSVTAEVNIVHGNADMAFENWAKLERFGIRSSKTVGFWAWELEKLPSFWRYAYSFYDEIWAATRFAEGAFSRESLRPVELVPMAVIAPEAKTDVSRKQLGLGDDEFVFLFMFDFRSYTARKNPDAVIDAFEMAFSSSEQGVRLVIKTQGGASAGAAWRELTARLSRNPRVEVRDVKMSRDELTGLIRTSNAFISLHRSEGFGRGPAEAMLLGVPVIVTDYSGTADFATSDCAFVVPYKMVPVKDDEYTGVQGQMWAEADVRYAAKQMRSIYENAALGREIGEIGKRQIESLYHPNVIGRRMIEVLNLSKNVSKSSEMTQ